MILECLRLTACTALGALVFFAILGDFDGKEDPSVLVKLPVGLFHPNHGVEKATVDESTEFFPPAIDNGPILFFVAVPSKLKAPHGMEEGSCGDQSV